MKDVGERDEDDNQWMAEVLLIGPHKTNYQTAGASNLNCTGVCY